MEFINIDRNKNNIIEDTPKASSSGAGPLRMEQKHKKEPKQVENFFCPRCDASFKKSSELTRHLAAKNPCRKSVINIENKIETPVDLFDGSAKQELPKFEINKLLNPDLEGGFSAIFAASRRSGKTTLIKYLYNELSKSFDIIIFFCDTLHNKNYSFVQEPKFNHFSSGVLNDLFDFQKNTNNEYKILIIMDDCVSNDTKNSDEIMQLYLTGRNWNISCIISSQVSTLINKKSRGNTDFVFIGKTNTPENRLNLIETFLITCLKPPQEIKTKVAKEFWLDKFLIENTEDYNFIVLDYLSSGERVYNFKSPKGLND